jgi:hypothetical protein
MKISWNPQLLSLADMPIKISMTPSAVELPADVCVKILWYPQLLRCPQLWFVWRFHATSMFEMCVRYGMCVCTSLPYKYVFNGSDITYTVKRMCIYSQGQNFKRNQFFNIFFQFFFHIFFFILRGTHLILMVI